MKSVGTNSVAARTPVELGLAALSSGLFVLTAAFETKRAGVVVRSVQQCASEPPLVCVAVRRGHWIEPLIRDSHCFAVCKIADSDGLPLRKFNEYARRDGDPFDSVPHHRLQTGSPALSCASLALDCEVVRHFDIEADHEIYIGRVVAARIGQHTGALLGDGPLVDHIALAKLTHPLSEQAKPKTRRGPRHA